ncbi:MAG: sensor histidine kinase [Anaerolineae bacterium]
MRSLAFKLVFAFLLVSLTSIALVAVFARRATVTEFDRFVLDQAQSDFVAAATAYYETYGSWRGVAEYVRQQRLASGAPPPPGGAPPALPPNALRNPQPGQPRPFLLVDQEGRVVVPAEPFRLGDYVPAEEMKRGIPIEVDGQVVGRVIPPGGAGPPPRESGEERYLARTNRALLLAAVGAAGIALLLGILLARTLTQPLRDLTSATGAMAKGEIEQEVPVRSSDELGELAASFNRMSADLARANQLRRQMTADIAHDLRSPLTVIAGYVESLRDGVLKPTAERFDTIYSEVEHLQRLVEDLRTLSLADAGELTLNRQPTSPRSLLERQVLAHQHQARQQNVTLQVKADPALPEINVDPERMAQVLGNLVSNALRYTPAGGQIVLSAEGTADTVLLSVQDSGAGIAPEDLPRVFDRFYRGDAARQQQDGESGLGLAIAKAMVEAHGGTLSVASELGRGTTFIIALPVDSGVSPPLKTASA